MIQSAVRILQAKFTSCIAALDKVEIPDLEGGIMIRLLVVMAFGGLALGLGAVGLAQDTKVEKGKAVYDAAAPMKCKICHSIAGSGTKGPLDGVGARLKADEIKAWVRTPKEMAEKTKAMRKPAMPAYPKEKLSDEDLDALTAYLLSLKK
jgi:mono/diheme cytochrome c family protein